MVKIFSFVNIKTDDLFYLFNLRRDKVIMKKKKPGLTERQMDVLKLMVLGIRNNDIGKQLCICNSTVKAHLSEIYEKLGVKNRTEATRMAILKKIIPPQDSEQP